MPLSPSHSHFHLASNQMELTAQFASRLLSCTPKLLNNPLETSRRLALSTTTTPLRNQKRSGPGPPRLKIVNARRESGGGAEVETAVAVKEKPKSERFEVYRGSPTPFGATAHDGGVNFAIFSANAVSATLCLISLSDLHDVGSTSKNQFTWKTYLIRYWDKEIQNNHAKPIFLLSKASPLSTVESDSFSKLAAQNALSSRLSTFCASANLLCFPDSLPPMFNKPNGVFGFYGYGGRAVVGQKVYVNSTGTKGGSSELTKQKEWVGPGIFFRESMLKKGKVIPMPDINDKYPERSFLPRSISSKQPFSTLKVSELKQIFHVGDYSTMETMIVESLSECKRAPSPGETKRCVSSAEDMIDFAVSMLGRNIDILTTKNVNGSKQSIMIGSIEEINGGKVMDSVSCHQLLFPYLLYYCHSVPKARVYQVDILDPNSKAKINNGVAICHMNTSGWNPTHEAFLALGSAPGRIEVCHWIFQNDLMWTVVD